MTKSLRLDPGFAMQLYVAFFLGGVIFALGLVWISIAPSVANARRERKAPKLRRAKARHDRQCRAVRRLASDHCNVLPLGDDAEMELWPEFEIDLQSV